MNLIFNTYFVYGCVFLAVVLPVALWRRGAHVDAGNPAADNLPGIFKMTWSLVGIFEFPFGVPVAKLFPRQAAAYRKRIPASGLPLTAEKIFCAQTLSLVGAGVLGVLLFWTPGVSPIGAGLLAAMLILVAWSYPAVAFESYVQWRQTEITRTLPFAIDLIGSAMRAGLEFGAALRYFVGLRMKGPLTDEFGKVLQQIELGKTRTEALSDMAARVDVEAFTSFVGVVAYGTEIGASISDTLRVHGEELRRARFHLAERKAARAPSLMILPMALFIMPAVFIIVITPVVMKMKGTGIGAH